MVNITMAHAMGYQIIVNEMLVVMGDTEFIKRTWKERLFSKPWRPFLKTRCHTPMIPMDKFIVNEMDRTIMMHPIYVKKFKESLESMVK